MKSALIVIDVQESFRQRPDWSETSNPDVVADVGQLVGTARADGHLVIWVLHSSPGTGTAFDPELGHVKLLEGLEPAADEPVLVKTSRNAFTTTNLDQTLTQNGIGRLVVSGIRTEECCETTARLGGDLGYDVNFVSEAMATFPIVRPDTGTRLECEAIVARSEAVLAGRFARISPIAEAFGDRSAHVD